MSFWKYAGWGLAAVFGGAVAAPHKGISLYYARES